ncbi:DsbE family thiol:disulfide interchange protein [Moritella sp. F3]|uniref:DsbE family thiol:disulfide interchange protein n=1 Tax=Moritella sp. F3 TaxID=2718882 RepID=UPI0018E1611C|nr:DsbE family thiol:disulfide interchange protein [Moritella sp. F3]GIC78702.1 thiol:disulfide interchange protein DsbE [Moritella sp. F1]GIC81370.1 thiol:disulfide interchange protein DsbE [Moritella sp. F3]
MQNKKLSLKPESKVKSKFKLMLPSLLGLVFVVSMMFALTAQEGQITPSVLVGKPIPSFTASDLDSVLIDNSVFQTDNDLSPTDKRFTLLNVWASWCGVCQSEHDFLMKLAVKDNVRIVGLNYRDDVYAARKVISALGNPYVANIFDPDGKLALDMGVIATPETYLLDSQGIVLFRYSGALDEKVWQHYFKPFIQLLLNNQTS